MADNQPKHRQEQKRNRKLARSRASRAGLPWVLIVCEGRETEPNYLRGFCDAMGVNMAAVDLRAGEQATDATALVRRARKLFSADRDYERVFVVCDGDGSSLADATKLVAMPLKNSSGQRFRVELIVSSPSFEYWLLLHFEYSARPYRTAAEVTTDLRRHLTTYDKADRRIFEQVAHGLDRAMDHTGRLRRDLAATGAMVPDTNVNVLVEQLLRMRREQH
jgi:hypothetical protein